MKLYLNENTEIKGRLKVDYYVPITVTFDENNKHPRKWLIYRILNKQSSFIEIIINNKTKKLIEITFVSINNIEFDNGSYTRKKFFDNKISNPDFDVSLFKDSNILTDNIEFDNIITQDNLLVLLKDQKPVKDSIDMGYVLFLIDEENCLVGLRFKGFSETQWAEFNEFTKQKFKI